jgi:hypothetical protein
MFDAYGRIAGLSLHLEACKPRMCQASQFFPRVETEVAPLFSPQVPPLFPGIPPSSSSADTFDAFK